MNPQSGGTLEVGDNPLHQVMAIVTQGFKLITDHQAKQDATLENLGNQVSELRTQQVAQSAQFQRMMSLMPVSQKAEYTHQRVVEDGLTRKAVAAEVGLSGARVGQLVKLHQTRVNRR